MRRLPRRVLTIQLICGLCLGWGGGCSFGPRVLEKTHGLYNSAVQVSEEQQLLRNLVRVRYNERPLELNISSIAAQYELSGQAEARPFFVAPNPSNHPFQTFTSILPDFLMSGANRPTITFTPADDGEAVQRFLTPISAETLVFLTQTSWPVSTVLRLWMERLNGVPNADTASGPQRDVVPDFARFVRIAELCQFAQDHDLLSVHLDHHFTEAGGPLKADAITAAAVVEAAKNGMEYRSCTDGQTYCLVRRESGLVLTLHPGATDNPEVAEMLSLLNLVPGQCQYNLLVASGPTPDPQRHRVPPATDLRVLTRSTAQVLFYLANGVEVPADHLAAGLVRLPLDPDGRPFDMREVTRGLFAVRACKGHKPPPTAYVATQYRGWWYYIDDRDAQSKATFALVLQLSRLDFARQRVAGPLLTLSAGR
jgi:hypothetical protein